MYMTIRQRKLAAIDPTYADRLREQEARETRQALVILALDAATTKLARERDLVLPPGSSRKRHLLRAIEKHERLTAEAIRLGLILPNQETLS